MNQENQGQDKQSRQKPESTDEKSKNLYRRPNPVKRPVVKALQKLESATNETGESFNLGDKIVVTSPWGEKATAEIVDFYQDQGNNAWARYTSNESRPGWDWSGGCIRAMRLVKA